MNVNYINPVLESLISVLGTMAQMQTRPGKPTVKSDQWAKGDLSGIMSMVGADARVSMAITFTSPVILELAKRMLHETYPSVNGMVMDLAGEIANMVMGGAKGLLEEKGYRFELSLPTIIAGPDHYVMHKTKGKTVIIPFDTDYGQFFIELCFE